MLWRGTSDSFETFIGLLLDGIERRDRESISMWRGLFQSAQSDPAQATYGTSANPNGLKISWDKEIPERYRDIAKYGTPAGLSMLMR